MTWLTPQNTQTSPTADPKRVDDVLKTMTAEDQDKYLSSLPEADLQVYAEWAARNNQSPKDGKISTEITSPSGKRFGVIRGAPQTPAARAPTEEEMMNMTDDQLEKLAKGESVSTEEIGKGKGWLDNTAGQVVRAGVNGALALPLAVFDKVVEVPGITGANDATDAANVGLDALGLGRPRTPGERVLSDTVSGVTGALAMGGVGGMAPGAVGRVLGADVGKQALSGALGGLSAGTVRENGGSAGQQLAAGLIGGLSPQIIEGTLGNAIRRGIRGNAAKLEAMRQTMRDFEQAGTTPSVGQATGGTKAREVEAFLSRLYGSSGQMRRFGTAQEQAIGRAIEGKLGQLDPSGTATPTNVGNQIVADYEDSFRPSQKLTIDSAYDKFDKLLESSPPPRTSGLTMPEATTAKQAEEAYQKVSSELAAARKALQEARTSETLRLSRRPDTYDENVLRTTGSDVSARARIRAASQDVTLAETRVAQLEAQHSEALQNLRAIQSGEHIGNIPFVPLNRTIEKFRNLTATIPGAENISTNRLLSPNRNQYVSAFRDLMADINFNGGNGLPFEAVKKLRTRIGDRLADSVIDSRIPAKELRGLYATLSEDLKDAARSAGPQVEKAYTEANELASKFHDHLDLIRNIVEKNGGGEKVFQAAMSGSDLGATQLKAIYDTVNPETRKLLSAAIIRRMATSTPGTGLTQGDFNLQNFFKNYENLAKSPDSMNQVFGRLPGTMKEDFEKIAKVAFNIREGREEFGAATKAAEGRTGLQTILYPLVMISGGGIGANTNMALAGVGAAAGAGTLMGGGRYLAAKMTDPKFIKWLASTNQIPRSALPAAINQLAQQARRDHDDDLLTVSEDLKKLSQEDDSNAL